MFNVTYDKTHSVSVELVLKENLKKELKVLNDKELFNASVGEIYNNLDLNNEGLIYVGLGDKNESLDDLRMAGFNLGKLLNSRKIAFASIDLSLLIDKNYLQVFLEGLIDSEYIFDYYKIKKAEKTLKEISLNNLKLNQIVVEETINLMEGVFKTRDLVNLTSIDLYPETYATEALNFFKGTKVEVEVLDKKQIEKLKMHALLAVNKGSDKEPRFVIFKYLNNPKTTKHLTVVGKGVTYDSGGYAIKPASSMVTMKGDMAGSAALVGLFHSLYKNNLKVNVVGVAALTENMIDGSAYKNGDVISSMKGITIEVVNTDAEGRITLADSIYYAATQLNSETIIEMSTLTGAVVTSLGKFITGVTTTEDQLYEKIHCAGNLAGEFNWRMPITKQLKESVKSDIAELKNAVEGGGGVMTAGIFLSHFAEDIPFLHLDIAGTAFGEGYKHIPKGGTGVGVKTIYQFIKQYM